jgi:hypothetical protein
VTLLYNPWVMGDIIVVMGSDTVVQPMGHGRTVVQPMDGKKCCTTHGSWESDTTVQPMGHGK